MLQELCHICHNWLFIGWLHHDICGDRREGLEHTQLWNALAEEQIVRRLSCHYGHRNNSYKHFSFFLTDKRDALHCWWHLTEFSTSHAHSFFPTSKHILNPNQGSLFIHFYAAIHAVVTRQLAAVEWQYRGLILAGWPRLLTGDENAILLSIMTPRPSAGLIEFSKKNDKKSIYTYFIYTYTLRFTDINTCVYICTVKGKLGDAVAFEWVSLHLPGMGALYSSSWNAI